MKILKNSSGQILLNGGNPITIEGAPINVVIHDEPSFTTITHIDLVNFVSTKYTRPQHVTVAAHVGDIFQGGTLYVSDYEYSGVQVITPTEFDNVYFRITGEVANPYITIVCFVAGTKITMSDGTYKNIEEIQIGDKVLGYNGQEYVEVNVLKTFVHNYSGKIYKITYAEGSFEATGNHPIYIDGEYKRVDTLKIGDNLFIEGHNSPILHIDINEVNDIKVYNLDVDNTDNYIADFCLAHNKPT